jgi:hypothetical protein
VCKGVERKGGRPSLGQGKNTTGGALEAIRLSLQLFVLPCDSRFNHCVVTPVSAIVRKLEMVFGSSESAYLSMYCVRREQSPPPVTCV